MLFDPSWACDENFIISHVRKISKNNLQIKRNLLYPLKNLLVVFKDSYKNLISKNAIAQTSIYNIQDKLSKIRYFQFLLNIKFH